MDRVQSLPRGYPHTLNLRTSINLPMTIKQSFFHHHREFPNTDRTTDPWAGSQQNGLNEPSSTPGDLVSLAWLQKGDIIQIAPLDGEDDHQNCFENSTASLSSGKSDDFLPTRQNTIIDEHHEFSPFTIRSPVQSELHTLSTTHSLGVQRPASVDTEHYSPPCVVESSHMLNNHQLGFNGSGLAKPNYSYTHLIFMAIESTPQKCMTVNQIYNWCETNFPFYKHAGAGWKNSLRHNLSINKSFKRLPRDSRGPGRGAFWTVEPRERPTLLDAIKRNPWNFASMAALVAGQTDHNPGFNMFGMRHFGLTQSAPSQVLRTAGLGNGEFIDSNGDGLGNVQLPPGGVRLVPTSNGGLMTACDNRLQQLDVSPSNPDGDATGASPSASFVLPDRRYWHSPETNASDITTGVEVEWSTEDEEKYAQTLQLLMETGDRGSREFPAEVACGNRPDSTKLQTNEGIHTDEGKLGTKQRRKSRLQPTRIVEDNYPYTNGLLGKCNECKENAAAGCESCLAKRRRFLSDPLSIVSGDDQDFTDVANNLDSDQECGPAGGPAIRKYNSTNTSSSRDMVDKTETAAVKPEQHHKTSDEVYVTPAPYIDHEYSHCHAQLRRPEEIRLVNKFNELYCTEGIKRLSKGRSYFKRYGDTKPRRTLKHVYDESDAEYDDAIDDAFSSQDQATYSEEYSDASEDLGKDPRLTRYSEVSGFRKRRRGPRGTSRTLGPHLVENAFHSRDGVRRHLSKHSSRGRGRRKFGVVYHSSTTSAGVTRRSKRVIRAPKRPYDEFEDPFSIDGEDPVDFTSTSLTKMDNAYASVPSDSLTHSFAERSLNVESEEPLQVPQQRVYRGRRNRKIRRRRGRRPNSFCSIKGDEPDQTYDSNQPESTSDEDEEEKYLRLAHRRQQMNDSIAQDDSSFDSSGSLYTRTNYYNRSGHDADLLYKNASGSNAMGADSTPVIPLGLSAVWGQSRWAIAQKFSAQSWPNSTQCTSDQEDVALEEFVSEQEANGEEIEEYEEDVKQTESSKVGEHTTVEAAQILLGISQMQSFRRQSGYLSLDSSGTSTSLTIEAPEAINNAGANNPLALRIDHQGESSTPNRLSPSREGT